MYQAFPTFSFVFVATLIFSDYIVCPFFICLTTSHDDIFFNRRQMSMLKPRKLLIKVSMKIMFLYYFKNIAIQLWKLSRSSWILVPRGFGDPWISRKILALKYAHENKVTYVFAWACRYQWLRWPDVCLLPFFLFLKNYPLWVRRRYLELALVPGSTNWELIIRSEIKLLLLILMLNEELYSLLIKKVLC
jgi:hypothetical protein